MTPRFVADGNVGKLATWLRILGYDALFLNDAPDDELLRRAREEGRILLTKDRRLVERREVRRQTVRALWVRSDRWREQLRQVARELDLRFGTDLFTRCVRCNTPLVELEKGAASGLVPPYVYQTQASFSRCPQCERVYWQGTHYARARAHLQDIWEMQL